MNDAVTPLTNELSVCAKGGTELMAYRIYSSVSSELLSKFQIWFSRFRAADYDPSKYQIMYLHDLPGDPESELLKNGGWALFHKLVFVSHWQCQQYINYYGIPHSRCEVMLNAIEPIVTPAEKPVDKIRLGYWSTPHRGLNILLPVFDKLSEKYDNIELDVFSSFKIYGWEQRDAPYEHLFEFARQHPKINYHGSVSNEEIREFAANAHIFAYPSIWPETSCICLMEAMSAEMLCVHPSFAALPETSANWTSMYQFDENVESHAVKFMSALESAILAYDHPMVRSRLKSQKAYADVFYNWNSRIGEWEIMLSNIISNPLPVNQLKSTPNTNVGEATFTL